MQSKFTNSDLARLSIVLSKFIQNEPQNSSEGLEELEIKLKEVVKSNTHTHYSLNIAGCIDASKSIQKGFLTSTNGYTILGR